MSANSSRVLSLMPDRRLPQRTTSVGIEIVCPAWCTESASVHASDLDQLGGGCLHTSEHEIAEDRSCGPGVSPVDAELLGSARPAEPVHVYINATTDLSGRETAIPSVFLNQGGTLIECSGQQVLELADAIRAVAEEYRLAGGAHAGRPL